jgi:putative sigma-54 modulation protein
VAKLKQKAEVTLHVKGKDIFAECEEADLYAAIDAVADKLDRQVVKHKEKHSNHVHDKRQVAAEE